MTTSQKTKAPKRTRTSRKTTRQTPQKPKTTTVSPEAATASGDPQANTPTQSVARHQSAILATLTALHSTDPDTVLNGVTVDTIADHSNLTSDAIQAAIDAHWPTRQLHDHLNPNGWGLANPRRFSLAVWPPAEHADASHVRRHVLNVPDELISEQLPLPLRIMRSLRYAALTADIDDSGDSDDGFRSTEELALITQCDDMGELLATLHDLQNRRLVTTDAPRHGRANWGIGEYAPKTATLDDTNAPTRTQLLNAIQRITEAAETINRERKVLAAAHDGLTMFDKQTWACFNVPQSPLDVVIEVIPDLFRDMATYGTHIRSS